MGLYPGRQPVIIAGYRYLDPGAKRLPWQGMIMADYHRLVYERQAGWLLSIACQRFRVVGRKKLLYIMGIDWQWIYQRPQVIGRHLETEYDVMVIFPRSVFQCCMSDKANHPQKYGILWTLPFQEKNAVIGCLARTAVTHLFRHIESYDGIVIGYPLYYRYIPASYNGKVIYDCMDNHEALYPYRKGVAQVLSQEKALLQRCDALVASCQRLYDKMQEHVSKDIPKRVIRNWTDISRTIEPHRGRRVRGRYEIGYFGTLAGWLDYGLLKKSLAMNEGIEYHLIGPWDGKTFSGCPGLIYEGVIPHNALHQKTKDYACLIMPFVVNDIVEWVDPVKLYEYVSLGKCIVSVYYDEIRRFEDYIYFYRTQEDYVELIETLKREQFPPKYTAKQQKEFLLANSWDSRLREWDSLMEAVGL